MTSASAFLPSLVQLGKDMGLSDMQCSVLEEHERLVQQLLRGKVNENMILQNELLEEKKGRIQCEADLSKTSHLLKDSNAALENLKEKYRQASTQLDEQRKEVARINALFGTTEEDLKQVRLEFENEVMRRKAAEEALQEVGTKHGSTLESIQSEMHKTHQKLEDIRFNKVDAMGDHGVSNSLPFHICEKNYKREEQRRKEEEERKNQEQEILELTTQITQEKESRRLAEEESSDLKDQLNVLSEHTNNIIRRSRPNNTFINE
eukprot:m.28650 g.28650  ORF g.28650 m.28650 type:complete len:263 (+) comp6072_c0_seq2:56-844(+)